MSTTRYVALVCGLLIAPLAWAEFSPSGRLELHYINVGQGGGTLIIGPDGTRILYDFGNVGAGESIVRYLGQIGIAPSDGVDYSIVSHRDKDHYGGYGEVIRAGYDVAIANFDSGSEKEASRAMRNVWLDRAKETTAGAVQAIPVGLRIAVGDGAEIRVVAANGRIFRRKKGDALPSRRNENDRSVVLFVKYKNFDYVLDGDLGAGQEACTAHQTTQKNYQGPVAQALVDLGWISTERGVDVLHIAHHGSESSTSASYYNMMKPEVGLISVGVKQPSNFFHPRVDVTDLVLLGPTRPGCVVAPALQALFQTEGGRPGGTPNGSTSFTGIPLGDIRLTTDGATGFEISGTGHTINNVSCRNPSSGRWVYTLDEDSTGRPPPLNLSCIITAVSCVCPE
jgi:beta-lactamase superfamily II metal-dependent hydrolase